MFAIIPHYKRDMKMINQETAYNEIARLVNDFKHMPAAQRKGMNEMQTRLGYILPLFRALGWDINNINEVSPEEKVSRGWVDFSFRIGNTPRFFLETKRVNEDLNDPRWVKQAIDYAWTKSVTWALLSDFEGLRVFNAEWKESDPFRAQFFEFGIDDYLKDFERLWWLSKPETTAHRLDIEAEKVGKKIKRLPVSQSLFDDLKAWREHLFKNYKAFNLGYSAAQIDEAVLRLLNRLIFIRTAEDRAVEDNRLQSLVRVLRDKKQISSLDHELAGLFRELDGVYNSELFARHFSEELKIPPTDLEEIINGMYEKNFTRYNFNALEADVLGTAYEQYLGHVVAEGENETHVEEKKTKRKSQGIYYTPAFVTKYIVGQTVGKYLAENGYNPSKPPRVLDMACGSGSFLIEAFDVIDDFVAKQRGQAQKGEVDFNDRLRQLEVLRNCIHGVDKDKQAVEVARLNLLLRGLHSREKLPMLDNIANGDSLKSDTYPFHFPKVMQEGGFDVIIGNPPYVRQETLGEEFKTYAKQNFETFAGTADLYIYFIEQAHKLLKPNGLFGMIVSNKWMRANYGKALREFLTRESAIVEIIDFGELPVFENAATFPVIIITRKVKTKKQNFLYASIKRLDFDFLTDEVKSVGLRLDETSLVNENWTLSDSNEQLILEKIRSLGMLFGEYVNNEFYRGVVTGANEVFIIDSIIRKRLIDEDPKSEEVIKPFVVGDDVRKYRINYQDRFIIFSRRGFELNQYPAIKNYLTKFKKRLTPRPSNWTGDWEGRKSGTYKWFEIQDTISYYELFSKPKIVYPDITKESRFAFMNKGYFMADTTFFTPTSDLYLLGILNSKISFFALKKICAILGDPEKGGRLRQKSIYMKQLPIRRIDFDKPAEKSAHDEIVSLVEKILALQKERQAVRPEDDYDHARNLDREIAGVDCEIDKRVYALYGLTEEEIRIVEGK
jgi:type I restriction-modification system DNA methylase subunit